MQFIAELSLTSQTSHLVRSHGNIKLGTKKKKPKKKQLGANYEKQIRHQWANDGKTIS